MIEVRGLIHRRGGREVLAVREWQVAAGAHGLVIGPSGSGKTTLIHLLAGLLPVGQGELTVAGSRLDQLTTSARDRLRARCIAVVPQRPHLIEAFSVAGNLRLARQLAADSLSDAELDGALRRLGVAHRADARPSALSAGEAQRIAILRAVLAKPGLLLADEPTAALDDDNAVRVADLLIEEATRLRATLLLVTHDQRLKDRLPILLRLPMT
jgi:putative ABC transport system ATP-binding protein